GRKLWLALALAVPTRLWLGGGLSRHRDPRLITALVQGVRRCLHSLAILVCVDGLASYVTAFLSVFRHKVQGRRGPPRVVVEAGLPVGQGVKSDRRRRGGGGGRGGVGGECGAGPGVVGRAG